jgi:hypothetical protein
MIKFYLDFETSGHGLIEIDEPVGFDGAGFNIERAEGRLGRDVLYAGNIEIKLKFYAMPNHCFDLIMYNRRMYNHAAVIYFKVDFGDGIVVVGQLSLQSSNTDEVEKIEVLIVQENIQANFKRQYETNVNLFSPLDIKGRYIEPVQPQLMLLKAKPIVQKSSWNWNQPELVRSFEAYGLDFAFIYPFPQLQTFGIENSYAQADIYRETSIDPPNSELEQIFNETTIIRAENDLKNIKIKVKGVNLSVQTIGFGVTTQMSINYGTDYTPGTYNSEYLFYITDNTFSIDNQDYEVEIPFIPATSMVWINISIGSDYTLPGTTPVSTSLISYSPETLSIEVTSEAYDTVVPVVRYIDAIKYVTKSVCGLEVNAPRWEAGGEFYDQFITTTPLMRNLYDKPFNLSLKQIFEEHIRPEVNGDFEIQSDNKIFIGLYPDFYRDYQIARFNMLPLFENEQAEYDLFSNEKYLCNKVNLSFKNYASQKESEEENTYDIVHGESQWIIPNEQAQNKREIEIGFVRDAFLIEQVRRKAYDLSDTAATQDDGKIYIIDAVEDLAAKIFVATALLQHIYNEGKLRLRNANVFSWQLLGIMPGSTFVITTTDNAGTYIVAEVTHNEIVLTATDGENIAEESTTFQYYVNSDVILVNRTNEGFSLIENIADGDNYANLRFTKARILRNYYNQELAADTLYASGPITNSLYNNNPAAITQYQGEAGPITEGGNFTPTNPILTPDMRTLKLFCTLKEFWDMQTSLRLNRGYIAMLDVRGLPLRIYPTLVEWMPEEKQVTTPGGLIGTVTLTGEERYQPFYFTIFGGGGGVIAIDLNIGLLPITTNSFTYDIDQLNYLHIFGENGKQLVPPVPYNRVKVNNAVNAQSTVELAQWLNNLQ